jgi:hypothetical protein
VYWGAATVCIIWGCIIIWGAATVSMICGAAMVCIIIWGAATVSMTCRSGQQAAKSKHLISNDLHPQISSYKLDAGSSKNKPKASLQKGGSLYAGWLSACCSNSAPKHLIDMHLICGCNPGKLDAWI